MRRPQLPSSRRAALQRGSAIIEFIFLSLLLMVPLVYLMIAVFDVQRSAFGAAAAARAGARAFNLAGANGQGIDGAENALFVSAHRALADQNVADQADIQLVGCDGGCLQRGSVTTVRVSVQVPLPLPDFMAGWYAPSITVNSTHRSPYGQYTE